MKSHIIRKYPSVDDLRTKAKSRIPKFAFEYLDGGCNDDVNLKKNTSDIREVELIPQYLKSFSGVELKTELFGHTYDAPFGVAPIGLQGLIWPKAPEILARAAFEQNIPFILSTVTTAGIEEIGDITQGKAWFQLYYPREPRILEDILSRLASSQYKVLVLLCDVPSFGYRPRDIRNGLSMPPELSLTNLAEVFLHPAWGLQTAASGIPAFKTLERYMPGAMSMKQLGSFMNQTFSGRLDRERVARIRDQWKGKLILKGVSSIQDARIAVELGIDGLIVSNHGGRQLDSGESSLRSMISIAEDYGKTIKVMMDSGIQSGSDIARVLAAGASFAFLGRSFMYGVAALGERGGDHTISLLKTELHQVMEQIGAGNVALLPDFLKKNQSRMKVN